MGVTIMLGAVLASPPSSPATFEAPSTLGQSIIRMGKRIGLQRSRFLYYCYHRFVDREPHVLNMPNRSTILPMDGQRIWVGNPRESCIGRSIFFNGLWEPEATELIHRELRQGMVVADVGAHTGYYSLLAAKRVGPTGSVMAFEPEAVGLDFLHRNLRLNGHTNVDVFPVALSDVDESHGRVCGKTYLRSDPEAEMSADSVSTGTPIRAFDALAKDLGMNRLDFVKIDVEGAEADVLLGMQQSLERWKPMILLEVHPPQLAALGRSEEQIVWLLDELGYVSEAVSGPSPSGVYTSIYRPR